MAKKNKSDTKQKASGTLEAALKGLRVIEKDVAKVRGNLRKFLDRAEDLISGVDFVVPRKGPKRKKTPRK
jgi:hypothetical protein